MQAIRGTFIHSQDFGEVEFLGDALLVIDDNGIIVHLGSGSTWKEVLEQYGLEQSSLTVLEEDEFIVPGFIDTHVHAPQYQFTGSATDRFLMEWLDMYTFPAERRLKDVEMAKHTYSALVKRLLSLGTTTAVYYGTVHLEPSTILADMIVKYGQRAVVGKVAMDRNAPTDYKESTEEAIESTRQFLEYAKGLASPLVMPCVVPRFIPTCTPELLKGVGKLAAETGAYIQSHMSESCDEVACSRQLHPEYEFDWQLFDECGLLTDKAIMAHGTQLSDEEFKVVAARGAAISHCPLSNFYCGDTMFRVKAAKALGVKVGLGTDIAGGYSPSMLTAIRTAEITSRALRGAALMAGKPFGSPEVDQFIVTFKEGFYLATMGGAEAIGLEGKLGSFAVGKEFDAQRICTTGGPWEVFPQDSMMDIFEKWVHLGDDRNTKAVWVRGQVVFPAPAGAQ